MRWRSLDAVGADGAAADLVAVADQVVLLGEGFGRVGVKKIERVVRRRAEGVMRKGQAAGFLVGLEEREVDDPAEGEDVGIDQPELLAQGQA